MSKLQFSVYSATQIKDHPANNSPSKLHYSFMRSPRFPKVKAECQHAYYNQGEVRGKRATSFGCGSRSDFTKPVTITPAPVSYEKTSDFDKKHAQQHGKTFGVSRDSTREFGHITPGPLKNPGVGNYTLNRDLNYIGYTMRGKTPELNNPVFLNGKTTYLQAPGPGQYEQEPGIKNTGRHFFSKYQSSGACTINPPQSKRFPGNSPQIPGPSHYANDGGLNSKARYVLSQHRGNGTRAFSLDKRIPFTDRASLNNFAPGPGSYRQLSDFGIYENAQKLMQTSTDFGRSSNRSSNRNTLSGRQFQTQPDLNAALAKK